MAVDPLAARRAAKRPPSGKPTKKAGPSRKNEIRSIDRLLAKVTDAKARRALEQRKEGVLAALADAARCERERKLSVRYHKVKFFGAR